MIYRESDFVEIKKIVYGSKRKLYYDFNSISKEELRYIADNISILGIYLSYLELNNIEYKVSVRPDNKFYFNKCFIHNCRGVDYPFIVLEKEGLFACHGCNYSGHIVDFIAGEYNLTKEETLKIIYSYINKTYDSLSDDEKELYDKVFYRYDLKNEYIEKSSEKTKSLKDKIKKYAELRDEIDYIQISERLSCSKEFVERTLKKVNN